MKHEITTDIAVVGAGTAGLSAFHEIRACGAEALLVDRGPLGTTCARVGCMPSKAALHAGEQWTTMLQLDGGQASAHVGTADTLWRDARSTRDRLARGAAERTLKAAGDRLLMGEARFVDTHTLRVGNAQVRARAFVIATRSHPVVPASLQSLGERLLTTDSLFELDSLPRSIGVIGMGAIGLEMGLALSRLGVRVVGGDLQNTLAGIADPAILDRVLDLFSGELTLWLGQPIDARLAPGGKAVEIRSDGRADSVELVLAALGRRPNVEALDLAQAGVALDEKGQPTLDPITLRAVGPAPVFLAGDVSPDRPLMHEAADEGVNAARSALQAVGLRPAALLQRRAPISIVFSNPDIAFVGTAFPRLDSDATIVGIAEGSGNGRSRILHAEGNLVRVYVDKATRKLLGAGLVATRAEHLAHQLAWAVQRGDTIDELLTMPYYHPSIEEMLQSAFKDAARRLM
ncbi:MAG: dihydrolipoyl dehydrogenase [Gammaproteobacteria bacterium]|nr:dihydrolipoyl dehydrogenase [Gammaproteobacteria bacterium]